MGRVRRVTKPDGWKGKGTVDSHRKSNWTLKKDTTTLERR